MIVDDIIIQKYQYVIDSGVATHPGDYGFTSLADIVLDKVKNYYVPMQAGEITSNIYKITNQTIFASPSKSSYNK